MLGAIGASGASYSSLVGSCGRIKADVSSINSLASGKSAIVHTCWQVSTRDAASLVMYYASYDGSHKTYFSLR